MDALPTALDNPNGHAALWLLAFSILLIGWSFARNGFRLTFDTKPKGRRAELEDVPSLAALCGTGNFNILFVRQSGNVHAHYQATSASAAIAQALATFRRAKIHGIVILCNSADELHFYHSFHCHRGSSEGRKVGGVRISRLR